MKNSLPLVRALTPNATGSYTQCEECFIVARRMPIGYGEIGLVDCIGNDLDWTDTLIHALKFKTKKEAEEWVEYERMNEPRKLLELFPAGDTFNILKVNITATFIHEATRYTLENKEAR